MIKFADEETKLQVRQMWKICFEDTDEFLDVLFKYKYRNENTLIYFEGDVAVASLQMLPYAITFCGETIPFAYMAGLCTLPEYRNRGYMPVLIDKAHEILAQRNIPLAILIPAEDWLYKYYERFGYTQVFDKGSEPIYPIEKILSDYPDMDAGYVAYNAMYRCRDFCVQKSFDDFVAIAIEQDMDGFPEKYNLPGMACIIDEFSLLNLYAEQNKQLHFRMKINNQTKANQSEQIIAINRGFAEYVRSESFDIAVDLPFLCQLLFGYKTNKLIAPYNTLFPVHQPIMNQMLE